MDSVRNPYSPGAGNPPPELAGRLQVSDQLRVMFQRMALGKSVQYPILHGLRGVGKTVLLIHARELAETARFIAIDIESHEGKSLPQLLVPGIRKALLQLSFIESSKDKARRALRVLRGFLDGLNLSYGDWKLAYDPEQGTADTGDLEVDLSELLLIVGEAASAAGRPIALIIDELQYLSTLELSALIMAMHKINQRSLPIAFVGAGLPQILGLAGNSKSYAERLFIYPEIGALEREDAREAIVNPVRNEQAHIDEDAVEAIMQYTECYPYFIQQWSHDAWNVARNNLITLEDVREAHQQAIATLDKGFFKVRFDRSTSEEKRYMRALADLGPGLHRTGAVAERLQVQSKSVAPVRDKLIKKGMIYSPSYGDQAFTVPMFDAFMRRAIPVFEPKR